MRQLKTLRTVRPSWKICQGKQKDSSPSPNSTSRHRCATSARHKLAFRKQNGGMRDHAQGGYTNGQLTTRNKDIFEITRKVREHSSADETADLYRSSAVRPGFPSYNLRARQDAATKPCVKRHLKCQSPVTAFTAPISSAYSLSADRDVHRTKQASRELAWMNFMVA